MIEQVKNKGDTLSIIIRADYKSSGIEFFTPADYSQQLAYMNRDKGYIISPHLHNPVQHKVQVTQEVLYIKKGKLRVDFYDNDKVYLESRVLNRGDIILLAYGGHGFQMIEPTEIIEIKQGPYAGDDDKTRFDPVDFSELVIN
jgi:mannose-6-phosphate isomerase-like protein (cupin superfamily)